MEKGLETGLEKGLEKGREQTLCELLEELLVARFGPLSETVRGRLAGADSARLAIWFRRALTASSLDAVFAAEE
jgi:hypothetical protein